MAPNPPRPAPSAPGPATAPMHREQPAPWPSAWSSRETRYRVCWAVLALGAAASVAVPRLRSYTEIDWKAYMQEVEGPFVRGDFNYENLEGDTGPLVYPAGFVYVYELLRRVTSGGTNIWLAQNIFAALHAVVIGLVLVVYASTDSTPVAAIPLVALSPRTHSIFELRLFNDGVASMFAYAAVVLGSLDNWALATLAFAFGVSVKMNVLLMAPAFAVLVLEARGFVGAAVLGLMFLIIQATLALPFLAVNPDGYVKRSFDLGRVFLHKWTVNFKFLPEDVFQSRELALLLLACTLLTWLAFGHFRWAAKRGGLVKLLTSSCQRRQRLRPEHVATCMFESNLVGIVFARSLHYQFYAWYSHALPYIVWRGALGRRFPLAALSLWLAVEWCFNVFPATPFSSALLQLAHLTLLVSAWFSPPAVDDKSS